MNIVTIKSFLLTTTALSCVLATHAVATEPLDLPEVIADPLAGEWVVDRLAGNCTAGPRFFQGPAREVGGLGRPGACPLPDGRVLVPFRDGLAEIDREGTLRLVAPGRFLFGTTGQVTAHVMAYNPRDRHVYAAGPNCIRRIVERADGPWRSEVIAGVPSRHGSSDGPAKEATFGRIDSIVINGRGTIVVLDDNRRIRKVEDGTVTTLNAHVSAGPAPVDGPLANARFHMIGLGGNLSLADDDTLYLSDHWNFVVRKIDLKTQTVSTVAGMPKPTGHTAREKRYNRNSDGPARTWASFNSGCAYVCWDPVHQALWCGGPDENRFRWLKEGEIRTVIGAEAGNRRWDPDALQVPATSFRMSWNAVVAVDGQGRAYLSCSQLPHGLWRAYQRKKPK